jgi:hypothetical protein
VRLHRTPMFCSLLSLKMRLPHLCWKVQFERISSRGESLENPKSLKLSQRMFYQTQIRALILKYENVERILSCLFKSPFPTLNKTSRFPPILRPCPSLNYLSSIRNGNSVQLSLSEDKFADCVLSFLSALRLGG